MDGFQDASIILAESFKKHRALRHRNFDAPQETLLFQ
jgi:hypothetical protein